VRDVPDAGGEEARLVAVGCPTLLAAQGPQGLFGYMPANFDLFLNALTWLQDRPENISVRSKTVLSSPLTMSAVHVIVFGVIFALVVPLGLFSAGFVVWLRRRHL
jgi:hypothetical protein